MNPEPSPSPAPRGLLWLAAIVFAIGVLVRVWPSAGFVGVGFDEALYRDYAAKLDRVGLLAFPEICELFLEDQRKPETITKLPPTRFLYVFSGWVWKRANFGDAPPFTSTATGPAKGRELAAKDPYIRSLHRVSCLFSVLLLGLSGVVAWRMLGPRTGIGVLALMACAPLQIHMGQHALIDGFFAFWATLSLWLLWENLRAPNQPRWLLALAASLALMVLTKENSFFVFVALAGLVVTNRWAKFGTVTPQLLAVMFAGPFAGLATLVVLAGGVGPFVEIYRLLVSKAQTLDFAIKTGDGPWHRYIVDVLLVSPLIVVLGIGGIFTSVGGNRALVFLTAFIGFSYVIMCNVRYGMNLRYTSIWDLPLRALAFAQIALIASRFGKREAFVATLLVCGIGAYELRQYWIFFSDYGIYEPVSEGLLRAVKILK